MAARTAGIDQNE